jgi:hypothetical protein
MRMLRHYYVTIGICLVCMHASSMPLAPAPTNIPAAYTPDCKVTTYTDTMALLAALADANYECTEQIAAALRPRANQSLVDQLLSITTDSGKNARTRRNALRTLGRLAASSPTSRAGEIMGRTRAAATRSTLNEILATERDAMLLQDTIWIYDSFYFPSFDTQIALEQLAADTGLEPTVRARAAMATARLINVKTDLLSPTDQASIAAGLASDDPGVRAAAADTVARLRSERLSPQIRTELSALLANAWAAEPPLTLPADTPDTRGLAAFVDTASIPTSLTARAAIARAEDRLAGSTERLATLRSSYEALALPNRLEAPGLVLRAGLPKHELSALIDHARLAQVAYQQILGPELSTPLPDEPNGSITILVFANQAIYRDYMRAFTPFTIDVDGVYNETTRTLYTHQRRADQSSNTLAETIKHELTHAATGLTLFPGLWNDPGYHAQPRGWADEGLAELIAGTAADDADGVILAPRPSQLKRLCARAAAPALGDLLARRTGYDHYGSFDYDAAWALTYYLTTERRDSMQRIYAAYRDGSYTLANWPQLAGASVESFEAEWHGAMASWCEACVRPKHRHEVDREVSHACGGDASAPPTSMQTAHACGGDASAPPTSMQTAHAWGGDASAPPTSMQTAHACGGDASAPPTSMQTAHKLPLKP